MPETKKPREKKKTVVRIKSLDELDICEPQEGDDEKPYGEEDVEIEWDDE